LQREIKRKTIVYGILAVILATVIGALCLNFGIRPFLPSVRASTLSTFSSYEELENYLTRNQKTPYYKLEVSELPRISLPFSVAPSPTYLATLGGVDANTVVPQNGPEYSVTNIQVEGVDEADIVKTDGEYMYIVLGNNITILKAYPPEEAQILSQITLNGTLREIFINGDRLAVFGESYFYQPVEAYYVQVIDVKINETIPSPVEPSPIQLRISPYNLYSSSRETFMKVYNVSDRANPFLTSEVALNGSYFSSRMIGDYVYAVTSQPTLWHNSRVILPTIMYLNETKTIQPTDIYYSNVSDNSYAFTTIVAMNIKLDTEPVHKTYLLGSASNVYASLNNIYVTMPKQIISDTNWTETTLIYRVHIQDGEIESEATGEVPGKVLNQFSMDEYSEYFRIVTTTGDVWSPENPSKNNLYVLDMNLTIVGRLEGLAPTEIIYSVRFMGDRCYLVTFRQYDPFFAIDLQNPYEPKVLGTLKIPGYSSYLHPYDENHIIGIGMDEGKVKISLFDVSNISDIEEIRFTIGNRSSSPALDDHKALLFDKSKDLLVIPITEYQDFWQGAYVFNITTEQIELRGKITHVGNETGNTIVYYYYSSNYVVRSLYIDNVLYTISARKVKMNNLETLEEINEIELP